jgi:nucleotide-binding universal stress UspA family protein
MPVAFSEIPVMVNDTEMKANAENDIYEVKKSLVRKKSEKLNITTEVLMGSFYTELENYCKKLEPYVVVVGTHGTTASERFLFGSNAVYAMKHLKWPIITVPVGVNFSTIKKNRIGL